MSAGPPRRVLVLSNLYPSSAFPGAGTFVRDQVRELARRNRLAVVAPLRIAPLDLETVRRVRAVPRDAVEDGVPVTRPRFPGIPVGGYTVEPRLWASRLRPLLRQVGRELDAELVHAHFALPDGYAAARFTARERLPLVLTIWGSDVMQLARSRRVRALLRPTFAEARAVVAVSQELAARAGELGADPERLHVVPGGVPYCERIPREEARAQLGVDPEARCLLWVGGLVPVKQPLDAIRAFAGLRDAAAEGGRETLLVLVGAGPLAGEARDLVRRLGLERSVRLPGRCERETVWAWQCAADVLLNSSATEGTPLAVLEALGAGTPVVAYPLPGVLAAVEAVDGGRVAAAATPEALAGALLEELETTRDRDEIARSARSRFDIASTCRALERVYETVL
jgi:teichuronic acid biosynthesis glycosyltransferase TuaC